MDGLLLARGAAIALVMAATGAAKAEDDKAFSAAVDVVTDYVYRGVSFSEGQAAVQAYGEWSNAGAAQLPGLHAGGWVSSVDFGTADPAKAEVWGFVGYQGGQERFTYDVGLVYTTYPGAPTSLHYGYFETYGSVGTALGPARVTATVHYTPDYSGGAGRAVFADLDGEIPLTGLVKLTGALGHAEVRPAAGESYTYWSVGLAAAWHGLTAALRYTGNDLRTCQYPCGDRVVLSLGKQF